MAVSKRISWNFEGKELESEETVCQRDLIEVQPKSATKTPETIPKLMKDPLPISSSQEIEPKYQAEVVVEHDYENVVYDIYCPEYNGSVANFKPTKVQQLTKSTRALTFIPRK